MLGPLTLLAIAGAITAHTVAGILFRLAAKQQGYAALALFVTGNGIGFFNPLLTSLALRNNNPLLVYCLLIGVGGIAFTLAVNWSFRQRLNWWQWLGIAAITAGCVILQLRPSVPVVSLMS